MGLIFYRGGGTGVCAVRWRYVGGYCVLYLVGGMGGWGVYNIMDGIGSWRERFVLR